MLQLSPWELLNRLKYIVAIGFIVAGYYFLASIKGNGLMIIVACGLTCLLVIKISEYFKGWEASEDLIRRIANPEN